jgi:hypothetical protein
VTSPSGFQNKKWEPRKRMAISFKVEFTNLINIPKGCKNIREIRRVQTLLN